MALNLSGHGTSLVPRPREFLSSVCGRMESRGGLASIFQSKDDPETEFRFQSSVILKNVIEEAAKRADLLSWFLVLKTDKPRSSSHAPRGKVGNLILVFHFPIRGMPG